MGQSYWQQVVRHLIQVTATDRSLPESCRYLLLLAVTTQLVGGLLCYGICRFCQTGAREKAFQAHLTAFAVRRSPITASGGQGAELHA